MPFDPDKYLKDKELLAQNTSSSFDPDAYLNNKGVESIPVEEGPSEGSSAREGFFNSLSLGFKDEISGALEALGSTVGLRGLGSESLSNVRLETDEEDKESFGDIYRNARDADRNRAKELEAANPKSYMAGEFAGGAASMLVPGANVARGAKVAKLAATGAGVGAVDALGRSEADVTKGMVGEAAKDALVGGAIGGVTAGALGAAGKGISEAGQGLKTYFGGKALGLKRAKTAPSVVEEALTSRNGDKGIITPFASPEDMYERAMARKNIAGESLGKQRENVAHAQELVKKAQQSQAKLKEDMLAAGNVTPEQRARLDRLNLKSEEIASKLRIDGNEIADKIIAESKGRYNSPLDPATTAEYNRLIETLRDEGENLDINDLVKFKKILGSKGYTPQGRETEGLIGEFSRKANKILGEAENEAMVRISKDSPTHIADKEIYKNTSAMDRPLTSKIDREFGNKSIGLTDTIALASGGLGGVVATGGVGAAYAVPVYLGKKAAEKWGPQSTSWLIHKAQNSKLGKYGPQLLEASRRGTQAVAISDFLMQQNDPEYREAIKKLREEEENQ